MNTTAITVPTATRRLLHDLDELRASQVSANITAQPLDADIYKWHGNLRIPSMDLTIHFILLFTPTYPQLPPSILLLTPLPHPNVHRAVVGYKVCLDMLEKASEIPYKGWSQSYTARSILMQLEAFMMDPKELFNPNLGDIELARNAARKTVCKTCGHTATNIWPPWPDVTEVEKKMMRTYERPLPLSLVSSVLKSGLAQATEDWDCHSEEAKLPRPSMKKFEGVGENSTASPPAFYANLAQWRDHCYVPGNPENAGPFAQLPYEITHEILLAGLSAHDIANFGLSCRYLRQFGVDGYCWKRVFGRSFSQSDLKAAHLEDWKNAYLQECNFSGDELRCYATKVTWHDDVLGIPFTYTEDPVTKLVDYMHAEVEFLSRTAYKEGCRTTIWNHKFQAWCPVYINAEHFRRALPDIKLFMVQLSPQYQSETFVPLMAFDVLGKAMNTCVVLLMDKGIIASARAIEGYYVLYRLLLAILEEYPSLQKELDKRIHGFTEMGHRRPKAAVPSLSEFLPLVAASRRYVSRLEKFFPGCISEWLYRQILPLYAKYPETEDILTKLKPSLAQQQDAAMKFIQATTLERRILSFHILFLQNLKDGNTIDHLQNGIDVLFGHPPKKVVERIRNNVAQILEEDPFTGIFAKMLGEYGNGVTLIQLLQQAAIKSMVLGYHKAKVDYSQVRLTPISRILLRGQSYSAPPDLRRIEMRQSWRWDPRIAPNGHMRYLDASCTVYNYLHRQVGTIDYSSEPYEDGIIVHSGDIMNPIVFQGEHTILINMVAISQRPEIKALVFCASGWSNDLNMFKSPEVRLVSPDHEGEGGKLCHYSFKEALSSTGKTCVVMCILWRRSPGALWEVKAVGQLGLGRVTDAGYVDMEVEMQKALAKLET
ncbi:hypothetical protein BDZ91DRAFT_778336 [Kalaharituber pfeilii]|nr:hypothetical protein BDZ91DRAFT_778336 [Kalaharituber pfeilii]